MTATPSSTLASAGAPSAAAREPASPPPRATASARPARCEQQWQHHPCLPAPAAKASHSALTAVRASSTAVDSRDAFWAASSDDPAPRPDSTRRYGGGGCAAEQEECGRQLPPWHWHPPRSPRASRHAASPDCVDGYVLGPGRDAPPSLFSPA